MTNSKKICVIKPVS